MKKFLLISFLIVATNALGADGSSNKNLELENINQQIQQMERLQQKTNPNPGLQKFIENLKNQKNALEHGNSPFTQTEKAAKEFETVAANSIAKIKNQQQQTTAAIKDSQAIRQLALEQQAATQEKIAKLSKKS